MCSHSCSAMKVVNLNKFGELANFGDDLSGCNTLQGAGVLCVLEKCDVAAAW